MDPHKTRAAVAFTALTAKLYHAARSVTVPDALDRFALLAGPELLRRPWLEEYFDCTMVRDIYAAMQGRQQLYCVERDMLDLLHLQFSPITPEQQHDISQWIEQHCGVYIPEKYIEWMPDHEREAAITRLVSLVASDFQLPEVRGTFAQSVPLVLSTARKLHQVRDATGQLIHIQPMKLPPEPFIAWFKHRLVLAVTARLERCPDNPLWLLPDGTIQGAQIATTKDYGDFGELIQAVCSPVRRRRPKGSGYFRDADDFQAKVLPFMCDLIRKGRQPTQENVASYLNTTDRQIRDWLHDYHLVWDDLRQRAYSLCTGSDFSS